jgi:hypothetical protein
VSFLLDVTCIVVSMPWIAYLEHFLFRPGMLAMLAEKTASKDMSLEEVTTSLRVGKDGKREFVIDALVSTHNLWDKENLDACIADISTLKEELELSHFDVRVHTA